VVAGTFPTPFGIVDINLSLGFEIVLDAFAPGSISGPEI
jgi:hypothetical protein